MNTLPQPKPFLLIILDGWGISLRNTGNPIAAAKTTNLDNFTWYYPNASLVASGLEVGLPPGIAGNSETGHRNIGAGSVQYQIMAYIDQAIKDGSFFSNKALLGAIQHAQVNHSVLHLIGLVSTGGVHSHLKHLFALLRLLRAHSLKDRVFIHVFTDGRDTLPQSAPTYLRQLRDAIKKYDLGQIASVTGRFYAMDRNKNWARTQATFDMLTGATRPPGAPTPEIAVSQAYGQNHTDETIPPTIITRGGLPLVQIKNNDAVIFFNFRPDRARQLTAAFVTPDRVGFPAKRLTNLYFATLNQYDRTLPAPAAFQEKTVPYPLARVISAAGLSQLHIAETEKYAHITYYLNVGHDQTFPHETHNLIPSAATKDWSTNPNMAAKTITNRVVAAIKNQSFDVYFLNFANADMVGHTGNFAATAQACAFVDQCLGQIHQAVQISGGAMLITADHGKAESVGAAGGNQLFTEHTTNPVPFLYVREELKRTTPKSDTEVLGALSSPIGVLSDVAPTVLDILRLEKPNSMTGISLLSSLY